MLYGEGRESRRQCRQLEDASDRWGVPDFKVVDWSMPKELTYLSFVWVCSSWRWFGASAWTISGEQRACWRGLSRNWWGSSQWWTTDRRAVCSAAVATVSSPRLLMCPEFVMKEILVEFSVNLERRLQILCMRGWLLSLFADGGEWG